ncbi:phytolongin Phyl1.1-like [Typha latifolia]|uniref:phytolongin Phyl1.1-like n=1 Tax=Typha latifolia TaxID=4733 RepID=UPI003C2D2091
MNPRRSKSVKLISSHSEQIEIEIQDNSHMVSSAENTVYCCIAKANRILYSYDSKDRELEALAALCLENTPLYHKWYFHTVGTRTFGYLMVDGYTYFSIVDPSLGNMETLQFLEHIRQRYKSASKNGFHDELVPIIQQLIASLENMPRSTFLGDENCDGATSSDSSSSSKVPLLAKSGSKQDKKKMKEKVVVDGITDEGNTNKGVKIDMPSAEIGGMSLERTSSAARIRRQQSGRMLWRRHVKIVLTIDAVLCLVLFCIWLAVCKGFKCVSS